MEDKVILNDNPVLNETKTIKSEVKAELNLEGRRINSEGKIVFDKGNRFGVGKGRPKETEQQKIEKKSRKLLIEEYKQALTEALKFVSPVLITKALQGDIHAIKELNDRAIGKATQTVELSGKDGEPIRINEINYIVPKE